MRINGQFRWLAQLSRVIVLSSVFAPAVSAQLTHKPIPDELRPPSGLEWLESAKATLRLPSAHWANGRSPGQTSILDGRLVTILPATPPARPFLAGVPLDKQPPEELLALTGERRLTVAERRGLARRNAEWMAGWIGEPLAPESRGRLRDLYLSAADIIPELTEEAQASHPKVLRRPDLERVAASVSKFLLREREILGTSGEAYRRRFGRSLPATPLSARVENELTGAVKDFLAGDYMTRGAASKLPRGGHADEVSSAKGPWITPRVLEDAQSRTRTVIVDVGEPEVVAFEPRLFVAEHPAADWEWASEFGIVHTSLVGGIWYTVRQRQEVRIYRFDPRIVVPRGEVFVADPGSLESAQPQVVTQTRFASWIFAHGCSGSYASTDVLRRVEWDVLASSWQEAKEVLHSYQKDPSLGWDCLNNYGAYPLGNYGTNWVCHQACNAFSLRRWGLLPVQYWTNGLFLATGNAGISPCEIGAGRIEDWLGRLGLNVDLTDSLEPCIPRWFSCLLNSAPFAAGWGANLRWAWNPDDGWRPSGMVYVEVPGNLPPGVDDPPRIE